MLQVKDASLRLGPPHVHALVPAPNLDARMVVLTLTRPPTRLNDSLGRQALDVDTIADRYRAELRRQLDRLSVRGDLELCGRRSMSVGKARLIGYSVRVTGLTAEASLKVQEAGLGGRRAMGCGVFRPTRLRQHPG
jgi:CRISPR-associated protein Cas6